MAEALNGAASALTVELGSVSLPTTRDVWKPASTRRRAIAKRVAQKPKELVYYPALPSIRQHIWALWRNGLYGLATYVGGWTYKADCGKYINEMPVCWHSMPNEKSEGPRGFSRGPSSTDLLEG